MNLKNGHYTNFLKERNISWSKEYKTYEDIGFED